MMVNAKISTDHETIGTRNSEQAEVDRLERNAFYTVASVFALGSLMAGLRANTEIITTVLPFLILAIFFVICIPMAPLWMSTVDPVQTIKHKHVKSIIVIYGMSFMVTALAVLLSEMGLKL